MSLLIVPLTSPELDASTTLEQPSLKPGARLRSRTRFVIIGHVIDASAYRIAPHQPSHHSGLNRHRTNSRKKGVSSGVYSESGGANH
jgi:hypothetical protein